MALQNIVSDSVLTEIVERLGQLGHERNGQVARSIVAVKGFLDQILSLRGEVNQLVTDGNGSVNAADVQAITDLHARLVQKIKNWAIAL